MPSARQNTDGTFTITRDDGASFRSPIVPEGVGLEPVAPQVVPTPEAPPESTDLPPAPAAPARPSGPKILEERRDLAGNPVLMVQQPDGQVVAMPRQQVAGAALENWDRKVRGEGPAQPLAKDDPTSLGNLSPAVAYATALDRGLPTGYEQSPGGVLGMRNGAPASMAAPSGIGPGGQPAGTPGPGQAPTEQGKAAPKLEDFFGQGAGGSGSAGASVQQQQPAAVPSFRPAGAGQGMKELAKAKAMQEEAVTATAAVAQQRAAAEEADADVRLAAAQQRELQARELEERRARSMEEADADVRSAMEALQKPTGELDASRWWKSRDTGQKVAALVASFLSGMVGDVDPIQRAQEQDIAIQRDAYEREDKRNRARLEGATQLYGMMRQRFQDAELAQRAAEERAAAYAVLEGKKRAAQFAGPEAQAMAAERLGQLEQIHAEKREAMRNAAADRAARAYELELKRRDMEADLVARLSKTSGGHTLPAGEAAQVASFDAALSRVSDLEKAFKEKTGVFSGLMQHVPGTDATKFLDQKKVAAQGIGYILEGGKLTESDLDRYMDMLPNPGDSAARAAAKFENIRKDVVGRKLSKLEGFGRAGYNVAGFVDMMRPSSFQAQ